MENSVDVPENTKDTATTWPATPPLDCRPRNFRNLERLLYPKVHCSTTGRQKLPGQTPGDVVSLYRETGLSQESELLPLQRGPADGQANEGSQTGDNRTSMTSLRGGI